MQTEFLLQFLNFFISIIGKQPDGNMKQIICKCTIIFV